MEKIKIGNSVYYKPYKGSPNYTREQDAVAALDHYNKVTNQTETKKTFLPKKETVTSPASKPKTQVSTPTKQETKKPVTGSKENPKQLPEITVTAKNKTTPTKQTTTVNNQKTTVKPKEEVKTASKQTYLKPKGEVNMKVKLFQQMLLDEGMDLGKEGADGIWGKKTQEAFEKLQANKANYAIAMEKFKQLDEELQPKTIQTPQPFLPPRFAPASPATLPAFKQGGAFIRPSGDANLNKPQPKPLLSTDKIKSKEKGGAMKKKGKKCSCGCAMKISKNAKGGLIESCACGCSMKKHQKGGTVLLEPGFKDIFDGGNREKSREFTVTAKKPLSTFEKWKKDKANKPRIIPTPKVGVTVNKNEKGGKVTTNDSIQAYNRINAGESESGKGPQTKKEVIGNVRKGNFGPGNTKATFNKELKNKK